MHKKARTALILLVAAALLTGGGYLVYRATLKNYVDCARMLLRVYNADASDLDFTVNVSIADLDLDTRFRAVRFSFQDDSATQVTIYGKLADYTFYKIGGRALSETDGDAEASGGIPRNFMELLQWGAEIYQSDLEIERTGDRERAVYQVDVPDDLAQAFLDAYLTELSQLALEYSDCRLVLVSADDTMTELTLQGTVTYHLPLHDVSADLTVRAAVNALDDDVPIPEVPDSVRQAANGS